MLNAPDEYGATQKIVEYRFNCDRKLGTVESIARFNRYSQIISYAANEEIDQLTPVTDNSIAGVIYKYAYN
ncbi:hypothetical protein [Nostoc sp. CCY 9925]|uniref:hypothetical protein n=1 Tax=Nostoc sp. CCY 9925 TaxID=3103865 RepID=UPI0039C6F805